MAAQVVSWRLGARVDDSGAIQIIRQAAEQGDRTRRTARVSAWVGRLALPVAAMGCLAALASVVWRVPRAAGPVVLAVAAVTAAVAFLLARWPREVAPPLAATLDRDAQLDGELHSAIWFSRHAAVPASDPDRAWRDFHLSTAAARVGAVNWRGVYATPADRRVWALAALCTIATVAASRWPLAAHPARALAPNAPVEAPMPAALPADLAQSVAQGFRAISTGRPASTESLAAIGRALELANTDAATKSQLDALFAQAQAAAGTDFPDGDRNDENWWGDDERAQALMSPWALEWAYRDALARASASQPQERQSASRPPGGRDEARASSGDDGKGPTSGNGSTDGAAVLAETQGQAVSFSSLLFGRQQASGGAGDHTPAQGQPARTAALTASLRQEVVHASSDVPDLGQRTSGARRPERPTAGPTSGSVSAALVTYDRQSGSQPPPVPESRRPLLHDYFLRSADPPASTR